MFRFANIELLWLLVSIPVLIAAFVAYTMYKRRQLLKFGDPELVAALMPNASRIRPALKFSILLIALTMLIFALARPQLGIKETEETQQGIEAMVALDISNSMLAEDVAPNRIDRAKQMVSKLVDNMLDDRVGLVIFAGDAFTQLPITGDFGAAKMFLNAISPDLIRAQGTAIGAAIDLCVAGFDTELSDAGRAIIIITDGENHEDDAIAAAKRAQEAGIRVIVVGIGKPEGTTIPVPGTGAFMKDREGNLVVSKLNEEMCEQIAQAGQGVYVHCDNTNTALKAIQKELEDLKRAEFKGMTYKDYNEQFASFAIVALILLLIDFFIFNRKNKMITKLDIFGEKSLCILMLLAFSTSAFAQKENHYIRSGNSYYRDANYEDAAMEYRKALEINPDCYPAQLNLGNALYQQVDTSRHYQASDSMQLKQHAMDSAKYESAARAYRQAARLMDSNHGNDPIRYAKAKYNEGNCYKQLDRKEEAIDAYKEALRKNPKDEEARRNLAMLLQKSAQQQSQPQSQPQQQEQKEEEQEQQQQEQQMNQQAAEQLLQALEDEKPQQPQGQKRQIEKNW